MAGSWGTSWGGDTGSWLTAWNGTYVAPTPAAPPVVGGGGRRKPLHYVEIDGKVHVVADAAAAQALLESVRNETQRTVAKRIAKPKTSAAEHIVDIPTVTASSQDPQMAHRLQAQVDAHNANMARLRADAEQRYMAAMAELDDEEAIIALL